MVKIIKLIMKADKSIMINVNEEEQYKIDVQDRSINAEKIYEILGFIEGDCYIVETENEAEADKEALEFFAGLFNDITEKINAIPVNDATSETTEA